jgi:autotransporter-associated beta strand protein
VVAGGVLTKEGAGTLVLSGGDVLHVSGTTSVAEGTLRVDG